MGINLEQLHLLLAAGVKHGASDIHLRVGDPPFYRVRGQLAPLKYEKLSPSDTKEICEIIIHDPQIKADIGHLQEFDTSYSLPGVARFRVNIHRQRGSLSLILRIIPTAVPTIDELHLPPVLKQIAEYERGLVLVTGTTGAGKSSTLAAMIRHINEQRRVHIVTIEDPIEFLHQNQLASITQREIGLDTRSFNVALRAALRMDPDVILVGEMRDAESIDIALKAAETGHMVFSTVHTTDAAKTLGRLIGTFPPEEQYAVRLRLADTLRATISQRLLPRADGKGRCVAAEIMIVTGLILEYMRDHNKTGAVKDLIERGRSQYGMQSFDQHLADLFRAKTITLETALAASSSPSDFQRSLSFELSRRGLARGGRAGRLDAGRRAVGQGVGLPLGGARPRAVGDGVLIAIFGAPGPGAAGGVREPRAAGPARAAPEQRRGRGDRATDDPPPGLACHAAEGSDERGRRQAPPSRSTLPRTTVSNDKNSAEPQALRPVSFDPLSAPAEPAQLALPLPELPPASQAMSVPLENRVFVNRNLRLSDVDWLGFDMDYTLAIYNQPEMDRLQIEATLSGLVKRGYPEFVREIPYDTSFPIRGLMIDKKHGNVLKMDRFKVVHKAWHGMRELERDAVAELYQQRKIRLTAARYHWVDTLYALAEVTVYAALIDALERRGETVDYDKLFADIRQSIDGAHRDGSILEAVAADFPRYILRDPDLAQTLHRWRSAGKKLFLLTNSRLSYTQAMMTHLIGDSLPEYPSWRQFFDAIVVSAGKPGFFEESRPMMEREGDALRPAGSTLERGKIYEGGNLHDFERLLGVTGDRILYVGDHIYGDILRSKKESSWRTAMIIQEMTHELSAYAECQGRLEQLEDLDTQRQKAEDELRYLQLKFKQISRQIENFSPQESGLVPGQVLEAERTRTKRRLEGVRGTMRLLESQIADLEKTIDRRFHAYWGSLMKEGTETSSFGAQVEEYACLYTSKVSNFLAYSPLQHYRSPRDRMPHEL